MKFKDYRLAAALLVIAILDIGLWLLLTRLFPTAIQSDYVEFIGNFFLLLGMAILVWNSVRQQPSTDDPVSTFTTREVVFFLIVLVPYLSFKAWLILQGPG